MVRRLKAECDQRQLGLFGEGLSLGVKPKVERVLPVAPLAVVRAVPVRAESEGFPNQL
jgi:hypothetical protein